MESTRPIRALMRGLDALTVLNARGGATVSEVVGEIRLPRTTVYRILETLCDAGFVHRDASDDRYRLTILVRGLSDGFDDEAWVAQIAKPFIHDLCRDIVWPVAISTLSGTTMLLRETTDHSSPLATERYSAGFRVPLLTSASGLAYLAHCLGEQQANLIDVLARSNHDEDKPARSRPELLRLLSEIKTQGYATGTSSRRGVEESTIGVPVLQGDTLLAALTVRVAAAALPLQAALQRFLPKMRDCAGRIRDVFSEQQAGAHRAGAPETVA